MKKMLVAGMILCAVFCGLYAQEIYILKIKVQLANVRSEPDMNAPVIKQLRSGTLLEASQKLGDWFEITVKDDQGKAIFGYISQSVVDIVSGGKPGEPAVKAPERKEPVVEKEPVIQKELEKAEVPEASQYGTARSALGGFKVMGGLVSANMTYNATENKSVIDSSGTEDIKKNLKPLDYGLGLGAGASLPLGGINFFIEGRYHMGMAELEEKPGDYETLVTGAEKFLSKSRLMVFMLGIKF